MAEEEEPSKSKSKSIITDKDANAPNLLQKPKEHIIAAVTNSDNSPRHDKETHGISHDIDQATPVDQVKAPGVFHRIKEEVEAVVEALLPNK